MLRGDFASAARGYFFPLSQVARLPKRFPTRPITRRRLPGVAIFARAPQPGRAKTRLAPLLGPRGAACLQAALIADTIRKVEAISKHAACWLFSTGGNWPEQRGRGRWKLVHQRGRDLGERLERAFRRLLSRHPRAIVIGTDSPLLAPRQLREALSELRVCDAALGPCPDGGFYLVGLRCLPRGFFTGVRWSSRFALRDMLRNLLRSGLGCSVLEPIPDVDCPQDFRVLAAQMGKRRDLRRLSPALWGFVKARHKVRSLAGADRCP